LTKHLWLDLQASFLRVTAGFLLAAILGVPLGIFMGSFKVSRAAPAHHRVRALHPRAAPDSDLHGALRDRRALEDLLIWVGTFFQLVLMVADETRRVPYELLQVSYTLGARRREVLRLVMWRARGRASSTRSGSATVGRGRTWSSPSWSPPTKASAIRVLKFSRFLQTPKIWVYLVLLGLIGLGSTCCSRALNRRLFHWADTSKR
jgi:NitT/TauT family transport system permease protein